MTPGTLALGARVRVRATGAEGEVVARLEFKPGAGVSQYLIEYAPSANRDGVAWFLESALEPVDWTPRGRPGAGSGDGRRRGGNRG